MKTQSIRKAVGRMVFDHLVTPPERENSQLVFHGGDYGHGYLYEEIFCRDDSDLDAVLGLISERPGAVLDLAGGAGRLSIKVAKSGREVALVDKSITMLEIARKRKKQLDFDTSQRFRIYPQDIAQLQIGREFTTVFSINNGLEHLRDEAAILQALLRAGNHLHPEGDFFIDVHYPNYWEKSTNWKLGKWEYTQDFVHGDHRYRVWARTRPGQSDSEVVWEHAVSENLFDYTFLKTPLVILPLQRWHKLITSAGFLVKDIWGNWEGRKMDTSLPKMIFHVRKKA